MADDEKKCGNPGCADGETIAVGPHLGQGIVPIMRHRPDHTVEPAMARIVGPGETPTLPNPLYLEHQHDNVFSVKPMSKGGSDSAPSKGPAKVNSPAFKDNWDNIFGKKAPVGQA